MDKSGGIFANKKNLAYVLIVIAIIALVIGLVTEMNLLWILVAAAFLVGGLFFYRRARK